MSEYATPAAPDWICPCCAMLCEGLPSPRHQPPRCPRAAHVLADLANTPQAAVTASIDGAPAAVESALDAAAQRLAQWRQPLFAGLGTDIAGARALYRLAARTGAICDHADGAALAHGLRALQDRGQYTATLAEVRTRCDLLVLVGTSGHVRQPLLFERLGLGQPHSPCRHVVVLGATPPPLPAGITLTTVAGSGDLHADVQLLAAVVERRTVAADAALVALADALHAARYAVLVWEAASLPAQGALVVEMLNRIVGVLNRHTRAATLPLGGADGGHSVNQTFAWLTGLPTRTRVAAGGLQHEPHAFDTARLLARGAVDGLLWISSFDAQRVPPSASVPRIVFGPPAMASRLLQPAVPTVFVAVATPGVGAGAHLFRTDGPVVLWLDAWRDDGVPTVAAAVDALTERLRAAAP